MPWLAFANDGRRQNPEGSLKLCALDAFLINQNMRVLCIVISPECAEAFLKSIPFQPLARLTTFIALRFSVALTLNYAAHVGHPSPEMANLALATMPLGTGLQP
jgi:hypothetical protein